MYLKGLISKLYKEFNSKNQITQNGINQKTILLKQQKPNKSIKNGQKNWINISPKRHTNGQQAHEKFSILLLREIEDHLDI